MLCLKHATQELNEMKGYIKHEEQEDMGSVYAADVSLVLGRRRIQKAAMIKK